MIPSSIIEIQYFPSIKFFAIVSQQLLMIEQCENYQKRSLRNKCQLVDANGLLTLTVPLLKGKHQQLNIKHVEISYAESWQRQHLQSIRSSYGKSPYFEIYFPELEHLLKGRDRYLFDFNLRIIKKLIELLGLESQIRLSTDYFAREHYLVDWRQQNLNQGKPKSIQMESYPQVFSDRHGFTSDLSILDLLFCTGPEARLKLNEVQLS